ncbi:hypothetical protein V500_00027 [Pseudogymnoascus sp. VKM F-4518 (FW-2643)]|nr:hypothetical protein V500_00027 [Pseudogymnoascus sp. VKM F-4518 (FW-2643)]
MDPAATLPAAVLSGDITTDHLEATLRSARSESPGTYHEAQNKCHILLSASDHTTITPGGSSRSQGWDDMMLPSPWGRGGSVDIGSLAEVMGLAEKYTLSVEDSWNKVRLGATALTNPSAPADAYWQLISTAGKNTISTRYTVSMPDCPVSVAEICESLLLAGSARSSRLLFCADLCVRLILQTEGLLEIRKSVLTGAPVASCFYAEIRALDRPTGLPPLTSEPPPKGSGFSVVPLPGFSTLCARDGVCGLLTHPCVYSMGMVYCCGVAGRRMGTWAPLETAFFYDYSLPLSSAAFDRRIRDVYARMFQSGNGILGNHLKDVLLIKDMNFTAIREKASMEDDSPVRAAPCLTRWFNLRDLACYRLADAGFCHAWYDSHPDETTLAILGLGGFVHDLLDLGADIACAGVSNVVGTMARGKITVETMRTCYTRAVCLLHWMRTTDPYSPSTLALLLTHWWQLSNLRHRIVSLIGCVAVSRDAAVVCQDTPPRPTLLSFDLNEPYGTFEQGPQVWELALGRLSRVRDQGTPEGKRVLDVLVQPVLDFVGGGPGGLPSESDYYMAIVELCTAEPYEARLEDMWDLALVMWESGALWHSCIGGLNYVFRGDTNCDRARHDYCSADWTGADNIPTSLSNELSQNTTSTKP